MPWNSVLSKATRDVHVARLYVLLKSFDPLVAVVNFVQYGRIVIAFSRSPTQQALIIVLILLQGIILDYT